MNDGHETKAEVKFRHCAEDEIPLKDEQSSSSKAFYQPSKDDQFVNLYRVRDQLFCLEDDEELNIKGERGSVNYNYLQVVFSTCNN